MVVKKKLVENLEALGEILIRKVDTRVRYAGSVGPDRVGDMANTDCVQMFRSESALAFSTKHCVFKL